MAEIKDLSFAINASEIRTKKAGAIAWLKEKYRMLIGARVSRRRILEESSTVTQPFLGRMYMFQYLPKTRQKLPYYDMFPLVVPIEFYGANKMLGINFHYLPYNFRSILMGNMIETADLSRQGNEHFNFRYKNIKGIQRFRHAVPTLHRYDLTKVTSKMIKIDADDWATALYLPVEKFYKQDKRYVWTESRQIIQSLQGQ